MKKDLVDVVKYRKIWFGISLAITVPGLIAVIMCMIQFHSPLKPGIDFTGGSIMQYQFEKPVSLEAVHKVLAECGFEGSQVQQAMVGGQEVIVMRTKSIDQETQKAKVDSKLVEQLGPFKPISVDKVTATIGPELLMNGLLALFVTFAGMVGYISYRFKFDYALCAIAALFHDVLVLVGIFAILGLTVGTEVDSLFISAVLTVIGFSVHDTIVVFDRIRENAKYVGSKVINPDTKEEYKRTFGDITNDSVNQTLTRSIYTSLTVIITLLSLYLFGGVTTKDFVLAMLIGIISGTYSSIFNASCLLVWWREFKGDKRNKKLKPA
ncbi:MAG: protein translocase subunit SecF [Cyanobacteria bacterium SZAS LIN-2]|nr:protein translocase subunit SecF [Cyanobacteria bacterium SZAS LIN-3]MBS1994894.1 protein translocase subunit SecF [Cyanobacteria bacterium SZAS LIN-2]MBS2009438.1 protein translocase subunit SecF [Cyanobacteria bacterium SZAS TMP-1]